MSRGYNSRLTGLHRTNWMMLVCAGVKHVPYNNGLLISLPQIVPTFTALLKKLLTQILSVLEHLVDQFEGEGRFCDCDAPRCISCCSGRVQISFWMSFLCFWSAALRPVMCTPLQSALWLLKRLLVVTPGIGCSVKRLLVLAPLSGSWRPLRRPLVWDTF